MGRGSGFYIRKSDRAFIMSGSGCFWCRVTHGEFQVDHIVPPSLGGDSSLLNLAKACVKCNTSKSDRALHDWADHIEANRAKVMRKAKSCLRNYSRFVRRNKDHEQLPRLRNLIQDCRIKHSRYCEIIGNVKRWIIITNG